jgi:diguanylate cyclase (GGDEF)-like protein
MSDPRRLKATPPVDGERTEEPVHDRAADWLAGELLSGVRLDGLTEPVPPVAPETPCLEVLQTFLAREGMRVLPVVSDGRPVGLVNRHKLIEIFTRPFRQDLFRRRPIAAFMDPTPIVVDHSTDLDDLARMVVNAGLQQMLDGFIVTRDGRYLGLGNAHDLLNEITHRKQAHLYQLAHYDALTGLPNRLLFRDRLEQACANAARAGRMVALAFIDLDRFKRVNDSLGHAAGDALLQGVAGRLRESVRASDTVSRMGGDEFTLVLGNLDQPASAAVVLRQIRQSLRSPIAAGDHAVCATASIGVAVYPRDASSVDELLKCADKALYKAKELGRDTYCFYDAELGLQDSTRLFLEKELNAAIAAESFVLHYQPIVELASTRRVGYEALVRWPHREKGMIPPNTFIPIAEESDSINLLGRWVLQEACRQLAAWQHEGIAGLRVAVNVSARQLQRGRFFREVTQALELTGADPVRLELELSERVLLRPTAELVDLLTDLRALGIRILIDDFGTGCSSLSYLHDLPVDALKVDRSFVAAIDDERQHGTICAAIIGMAHSLGMQVIAEGVETEHQRDFLVQRGCDLAQGYLFGRPDLLEQRAG